MGSAYRSAVSLAYRTDTALKTLNIPEIGCHDRQISRLGDRGGARGGGAGAAGLAGGAGDRARALEGRAPEARAWPAEGIGQQAGRAAGAAADRDVRGSARAAAGGHPDEHG